MSAARQSLMEQALDVLRDGLIEPVERAACAVHGEAWPKSLNDGRTSLGKYPLKIIKTGVRWTPETLVDELTVLLSTPAGEKELLHSDGNSPPGITVVELLKSGVRLIRIRNEWAHRDNNFDERSITKFIETATQLLEALKQNKYATAMKALNTQGSPRTSSAPVNDPPARSSLSALIARTPAAQPLTEALENIRVRRQRLLGTPSAKNSDVPVQPEAIPAIDIPETFASEFWERQKSKKEKKPKKEKEPKAPKLRPTKTPHLSVVDDDDQKK